MSKPAAIHFEAKLYALRKSKDGLVLSFVVHPSDIPKEIITADIGEQYIVACAPYIETTCPGQGSTAPDPAVTTAPGGQAGVSKTEGQRAVQLSGIRCGDLKFQLWVSSRPMADKCKSAVEYVHRYCGVASRREFASNPDAAAKWWMLDTEYLRDTGALTEQRG